MALNIDRDRYQTHRAAECVIRIAKRLRRVLALGGMNQRERNENEREAADAIEDDLDYIKGWLNQ